jgi:hypothetical protein
MKTHNYSVSGGKKGINDLQNEYAFRGNSQGDDSCSNEISDYLASGGWMSFHFPVPIDDQRAIYEESERRKAANEKYIRQCKNDGTYGTDLPPIQLQMVHSPLFDDNKFNAKTSKRYIIIDTEKLKK